MNQIDFSIVFPSRDHHVLLTNLLASISTNTKDINRTEVLVAIDDDDQAMQEFVKTHDYTFVKFFTVPRSLNFSRDYYTYLYKQSRGKWIIACNDDAEFITQEWDVKAKATLEAYIKTGHNVVYGWIEDMLGPYRLTQFGNYSCFPLLGREGIDTLGYYFPEDIPTWGADLWCENLYRSIGRIITLPIVIKHISVHNKLRSADDIHRRIASNQVSCDFRPKNEQINTLIRKLRNE